MFYKTGPSIKPGDDKKVTNLILGLLDIGLISIICQ